MNKNILKEKEIKSAADVRAFLATHLPIYIKDENEEDFIFIVTPADIEQVSRDLWEHLTHA